jgi:two-component system nitrate/nitrite response regulator NarL
MTRILVVDDHPLVRRNVRGLLEDEGYQVCGEAGTGREAVEMAPILKPDLVVLDLSMPELNGLDAARQILEKMPDTIVLILTMHEEELITREALASGAAACVMKSDIRQFLAEVQRVMHPNYYRSQTSQSLGERQPQFPIADDTIARRDSILSDAEQNVDAEATHILRDKTEGGLGRRRSWYQRFHPR